jgi:O-antigen ligase
MGNRMESVWSMSQRGIQQAHDGYLELFLNLGWIGVAFLGMLIVTGYFNCVALYRRDPHAGRLRVTLLTAAVVYAFTEAGFRMLSPDWFGFLLAIIAMPTAPAPEMKAQAQMRLEGDRLRKEVRILH